MSSFAEIGKELGISGEAARLLYNKTMQKVAHSLEEYMREDIVALLNEEKTNLYDCMIEKMQFTNEEASDLHGFWKEENVK